MSDSNLDAIIALKQARDAYNHGKTMEARRYANEAIRIDPYLEEAWLILAAISTPEASIAFLTTVLRINPKNEQAQKGLVWFKNRLEKARRIPRLNEITGNYDPPITTKSIVPGSQPTQFHPNDKKTKVNEKHLIFLLYSFTLIGIMVVFIVSSILSLLPKDMIVLARNFSQEFPTGVVIKPTLTPTGTSTPLPTFTITQTPTVTIIPSSTTTLPYTLTPTLFSTSVSMLLPGVSKLPDEIEIDEKWIDVNVSNQTIYAMEGSEIINSFRVSTGKLDTPTVGGKFYIYNKLITAPMSGDDYYYPEIPFVMYFYQGYGFHGVTWPLDLGVPTSHGCINMLTPDAEWLFNWADVGTLINVHY